MKFNFKRIATVITGAVMLSSTVALAAAANFPSPFTSTNTAVVYGSAAPAGTDMVYAGRVSAEIAGDQLASSIVTTSTTVTGESEPVEKGRQLLYLGETMRTVEDYFTDDHLPTILKEQEITDRAGNEITVTQEVGVPNAAITYEKAESDDDEPVLLADFDNSENYTLDISFSPAVNVTKLRDKSITLFGKQFSFSNDETDLTSTKVTLVSKSEVKRMNHGEVQTVNGHQVSASIGSDSVVITVDDESETVTVGSSYTVAGLDFYVKTKFNQDYAGGTSYVDLSFNTDKLYLENGKRAYFGDDAIRGTWVTIQNSGDNVKRVQIAVTPGSFADEIEYLKMGSSFVDPVFGGVKFSLTGATPDLEDESRETIVVKTTGEEKGSIEFTNVDGNEYTLPFKPAMDNTNITLGINEWNVSTSATTAVGLNEYVITCDDEHSQIWEITDVDLEDTNPYVEFTDAGDTSNVVKVTFDDSMNTTANTDDLSLSGGSDATVTIVTNGSAAGGLRETFKVNKACNFLITEQGANISLASMGNGTSGGSKIKITEETEYNKDDYTFVDDSILGATANITIALDNREASDNRDIKIDATVEGYEDSVGDSDTYFVTRYGTFVKETGENDKTVTIAYSEQAMALKFYIGEVTSVIDDGENPVGSLVVADTDTAAIAGKNLVVVGGSCVNKVAQRLLEATAPLCGADFTAKTGIGAGQYLIKTFAHPDSPGKIATLVAGYEAAQTQQAVDYLIANKPSTAVGDTYETGVKKLVTTE